MPTYDYQCQACGHEWELFQSMNDSPVKSCPSCKKRKAKRLLGLGAGIIFKGTGFYETDYKVKKGEDKKESPPQTKSSDSSGDSSSKSSDSPSTSPGAKEKKTTAKPAKGKAKD